jgi:hypothetical protein
MDSVARCLRGNLRQTGDRSWAQATPSAAPPLASPRESQPLTAEARQALIIIGAITYGDFV